MFESEKVGRALEFATQKHKGQKRIGGDDYISHPIAVCEMVKEQGFDEDYQITALFHDLLEDTDATEDEIIALAGQNVLEAVKLVTKEKGYNMADYMAKILEKLEGKDKNQEYVIYVRTGALSSSKVQFSFGLGNESANATGDVTFKSYSIERVPYSAFSSASTDGQIGKIDISERLTLASSEYANFSFDKMQSESFDGVPYPATPDAWTKSTNGEGVQLSGIVNLQSFNAVMDKYSATINTIATPATLNRLNNNVLMIYNGTMSAQSYTSTSKTLTANKAYKITTFVNTHMWDSNSNGVTILAKTGSNVLAKAENIKTAGQWQRVTFEITVSAIESFVSNFVTLFMFFRRK